MSPDIAMCPQGQNALRSTGSHEGGIDRSGLGHQQEISRNSENGGSSIGLLGNVERPVLVLKCEVGAPGGLVG